MKDNTKKKGQTKEQPAEQPAEQPNEQQAELLNELVEFDDDTKLIDKKMKLKLTILNEISTNDFDSVVLGTIMHIIQRSKIGRTKYKADLDRTDKDILGWLQDAYEESLDKSLYLHKVGGELRMLIDKKQL
jgi:hypothetical protein